MPSLEEMENDLSGKRNSRIFWCRHLKAQVLRNGLLHPEYDCVPSRAIRNSSCVSGKL